MTVLDIITLEQLRALRDAGFVVAHREPTEKMLKTALRDEYCYGDMRSYYHRMIGESIREQNADIAGSGEVIPSQWTKTPPTVPGWYWFKGECFDDTIAEIHADGMVRIKSQFFDIVELKGDWCGPLTPPE